MLNVAILGSTGSIGTQTLNVIARHSDKFNVTMLAAQSNTDLLLEQYAKFSPKFVGIYNEEGYEKLSAVLPKNMLITGMETLTFAANCKEIDIIVVAVSGMIGLLSVIEAIKNNKIIALANKESLVAGGELINNLLKSSDSKIIPIDSEHSAIMQCLAAGKKEDVKRLILTASGGPFYGKTKKQLESITLEQAIKHPTWKMGRKISIDSATMMNKALEIIEARYLFDFKQIDYIVHKESIVHSMVEYCDGSVIAQLSNPSMEIPIQYALSIPRRLPTKLPALDFRSLSSLTFLEPDETVFPAPKLAKYALAAADNLPCIFNAANEAAVSLFIKGKIGFTDIYDTVEKVLMEAKTKKLTNSSEIFDCHNQTVNKVKTLWL